jgi:hypothetical protein
VDAAVPGEAGSPWFQGCSDDSQCVAPTTYCAIQPGQPGFCTAVGCEQDPNLCPTGATCFDVTPFGLPQHICIPPS